MTAASADASAHDEKRHGNAHVAEPKATAQSGDHQTRLRDVLVPDADPGNVASLSPDSAENEDEGTKEMAYASPRDPLAGSDC